MFIEELAGKNVVIIDDTEREVKSIEEALNAKEIKYEFIKVDLAGQEIRTGLIESLELVFLDLTYYTGYNSVFDPHFCTYLLKAVVPAGKKYYLVAWTKDPDYTEAVIDILREINLAPISYVSKRKADYRLNDSSYNAGLLLEELNKEFDEIRTVESFYGEIIEIEEEYVLINCLLDKDKLLFQVRRFDKEPFDGYIDLKVGNYLSVTCITKPGSRYFEFNNELQDLGKYFKTENPFIGLGDSPFFKDAE